jgi:hypothetical protein
VGGPAAAGDPGEAGNDPKVNTPGIGTGAATIATMPGEIPGSSAKNLPEWANRCGQACGLRCSSVHFSNNPLSNEKML